MGGTTPTKKSRKKHPGYHKAGLYSWVKDVTLGGEGGGPLVDSQNFSTKNKSPHLGCDGQRN